MTPEFRTWTAEFTADMRIDTPELETIEDGVVLSIGAGAGAGDAGRQSIVESLLGPRTWLGRTPRRPRHEQLVDLPRTGSVPARVGRRRHRD